MSGAAEPETAFVALAEAGRRILGDERRALLGGGFGRLAEFTEAKTQYLERLESAIGRVRGTPPVRRALARLIAESRRNERILAAARAGIARAKRRIAAIEATRRGDVAYAADGSRIVSRQDAGGRTRQA